MNPSALAAQALDGRVVAGCRVIGMVLPCVFGKSLAVLEEQIRLTQPEVVICTGLDQDRSGINLERTAINLEAAIIPDNEGNQPLGRAVIAGGPPVYSSTLPIQGIVSSLLAAGIPASVSQCAGTYVCNHVFYGLMSLLAQGQSARSGFIHVPGVPEQAEGVGDASRCLPLESIIRAMQIAIETSLTRQNELQGAT